MLDNNIQIVGMDKALEKVKTLGELKHFVGAMKASAEHIKSTVNVYPPAGPWNSPSSRNWYERGYGPHWTLASGEVHSKKTSQMLNRKWTIKQENSGLTQIIGNNVSYGPFVMDEDRQTWFHKAHGWKTVQTIAKEQTARVLKFISDEMNKIINRK